MSELEDDEEKTEQKIKELDENNFLKFLKTNKHVLVMFMSPYCPHCRKTKPKYQDVAEHFRKNPDICFTQVDCTVNTELCNDNDVEVYPLIKYFHYETRKEETYEGKKTVPALVEFIEKLVNKIE
ncbi:protein disulfide-isomerase A5-like isoform X2 [Diabrotica virgifera virgifera]|uniref:Protein disulfide-isomerase A5-like isoform X1 n=1 Tax=Diabrotica virgifera virgifera TaxID=50390 RepID=A0A6P7H3A6_DIAVI|nr:protein disulfide-isomerase A5-like isoform X2 [Diabrotica virgifera virgifera]